MGIFSYWLAHKTPSEIYVGRKICQFVDICDKVVGRVKFENDGKPQVCLHSTKKVATI